MGTADLAAVRTMMQNIVPREYEEPLLRGFVESIERAHRLHDGAVWAVSINPRWVRLTVGMAEVFTFGKGAAFIAALTNEGFDARTTEDIEPSPYKSLPNAIRVRIPFERWATDFEQWRGPHLRAIALAGRFRRLNRGAQRGHSEALISYLAEIVPREVPHPAFVRTLQPHAAATHARSQSWFPDEVDPSATHPEGAVLRVLVNKYERSREARDQCIQAYGHACWVCGFDFAEVYGDEFAGYIHVHHLRPLSEIGREYQVDPIEDLRPLCPNCHAAIHFERAGVDIDALKARLSARKLSHE